MQPKLLPKDLTMQWLFSASGSYSRASRNLVADIQNSDLEDIEMCRIINDRIMAVRPRLNKCQKNLILLLHVCGYALLFKS